MAWACSPVDPGASEEIPAHAALPSGVACRNAAVNSVAPLALEIASRSGTGQPPMSTYGA